MNNKIKSFVLCAMLMGATAVEAATVLVNDATPNNVEKRAVSLDKYFDLSFNANIQKSTQYKHATASVTTSSSDGYDWFSFTAQQAHVGVFLDIDNSKGGLDTWLTLEDALGRTLQSNNNHTSMDKGSTTLADSFLFAILPDAGVYKVRVSRVNKNGNLAGLIKGMDYNLHVSLTNPISQVPVPAAVWLFGSALLGLAGLRKRS